MVIVRRTSIDVVRHGNMVRRTPRRSGVVSLDLLARVSPDGWLSASDGVTRIGAAIVLTRGVRLDMGAGRADTVELVGGETGPQAAAIYTGGGRLDIHGLTVVSVDPATGRPVPAGPGRPFVHVSSGGRLDAVDALFDGLGTPETEPGDEPAISFGTGATGSLVRTTVRNATTGVQLSGSRGVRLAGLTVARSASDGLSLHGDQGTSLVSVRAEHNGGYGVKVTGPSSDRAITGISTAGNGEFGVAVVDQDTPQIRGISTQADIRGGLQLSGNVSTVITDFVAVDEPVGVYSHLGTSDVTLTRAWISGGDRALRIERTTNGYQVTNSTIEGAQAGISVGGDDVRVIDVLVANSRFGLRIERGAGDVTARDVTIDGGEDGVVVLPGTGSVVVRDSVISGPSDSGVRNAGPATHLIGGTISDTPTGVDARGATTIDRTEITAVDVGIRTRATQPVIAANVVVSAVTSGVDVAEGSSFVLVNSQIDALHAVNGEAEMKGRNDLSLPPLDMLGAIGIPLLALALVLDQVQNVRQRKRGSEPRRTPPVLDGG
jgi:hypothetical protein